MMRNVPLNTGPHVHVPYDSIDRYLPFIKRERLNLEIYFGSRSFDYLTKADIIGLKNIILVSSTVLSNFSPENPGTIK